MTKEMLVERLQEMLLMTQELANLEDPALQGDIQIILAILADKLRYLDPTGNYPHQVEYE